VTDESDESGQLPNEIVPVRMRRVLLESPYAARPALDGAGMAASVAAHKEYLRKVLSDAFQRGEAPFASHFFYTPVLDDNDPAQRSLGLLAGSTWGAMSDVQAFYLDMGLSEGMIAGFRANVLRYERAPRGMTQEIVLRSLRTQLEISLPHLHVYYCKPAEAVEYFTAQATAYADLVKRLS
jgi:hypothetical protein